MPAGQTSLQFVTVGDPGNVADTTRQSDGTSGYGSVPYTYNIGEYDVTLGQYTAFLNAVAKTDNYGLYTNNAPGAVGYPFGIARTGSAGSFVYSVTGSNPDAANMPLFGATWGDAARFCNWLQNGQPTSGTEGAGTTETGVYTLSGATTNAQLMAVTSPAHSGSGAANYFLPSENEWYKAAYFDPLLNGGSGGYYTTAFPTAGSSRRSRG